MAIPKTGSHYVPKTRFAMNVLAYVHLPEIPRSTGAGRVATQMTKHLSTQPALDLRVLGNRSLYDATIPNVGPPWSEYTYAFFDQDTRMQKLKWYALKRPKAECYWSDVDVMYCSEESYVPTRHARLAVTAHDAALFESSGTAHSGGWQKWTQGVKWTLLYRRWAKEADLIHTVSQFSAERIAHHFPQIRDRLCVVPNAVAPHFFNPPPEAGREYVQKKNLSGRPFVLLPCGLHYRKNADLVLEAWPKIHEAYPNAKLVVTSHNDPHYAEKAQALGDSVLVTDFLSEETLHAVYSAATVTWMPSRYEGFGLPVLESMACGTPVVTSDTTALPEVAGDAAILADVEDCAAHVDAVVALLRNEEERARLIEKGKDRAQKFTWERAAESLYSSFREIA